MLTSYRWRGVELNDGLNYAVATADNQLDDIQPADTAYAYRGERTPVPTSLTVKEATVTLNLKIIAANEEAFEAKLSALRRVFHPADSTFYPLERKLPFEQYYLFLSARPISMTVERLSRKVSVSFTVAEKAWQSDDWTEQTFDLWQNNGDPLSVTLSLDNTGDLPVEPIITVKPKEIATEGPQPIYYHNVTLYYASAQHLKDSPVRLVSSWNTTSMVNAGQMRSDGSDITVYLEDGTRLPRTIFGTTNSRSVWCLATVLPALPGAVRIPGNPQSVDATATTIPIVTKWGTLQGLPTSGKVCIGEEIISYAGLTILSADGRQGELTGCVRAQDGTTATDFREKDWTWVKFPVTIRIGYGYVNTFANTVRINNDYDRNMKWPLIDYTISDNKTWLQYNNNTSTSGLDTNAEGKFIGRPLTWRSFPWIPERNGERVAPASRQFPSDLAVNNLIRGTKLGLLAQRTTSNATRGQSYRERMIVQLNPATGRKVTTARIRYLVTGVDEGDSRFRTLKVWAGKTIKDQSNGWRKDENGRYYTPEQYEILHTGLSNNNSFLLVQDTGELKIYQDFGGATHMWLHCVEAATKEAARTTDNFVLHEVEYYLDRTFSEYPVTKFDSTQRGYALGEFPVCLSWQNLTDPKQTRKFEIWPRLVVDAQVVYDCANFTVSGEPLANCTYTDLTWLRLLPGTNQVRIIGEAGIGRVQITFKWKVRK